MSTSSTVLELLKTGTADLHQRVEQHVPVFQPGFDPPAYVRLLEAFYGFWAPVEARLARNPSLAAPALDLPGRLKSHLLEADLRALGSNPALLPPCPQLPALDSLPQGLGCLYVLEGSTLGARFISRRLHELFAFDANHGAAFFNAYGSDAGLRWAAFRTFLTAHTDSGSAPLVVAAARQTFETLEHWLALRVQQPRA